MDRSFLSDPLVVAAARDFVCIRLSTYESEEEAEVLRSIFIGRSGRLENTTFALLAPDGRRKLCRAGRSPDFAFDGPRHMAAAMSRIARSNESHAASPPVLPVESDLRLALNVARSDGLPLACAVSDVRGSGEDRQLAALAWSDAFRGRIVWVHATAAEAKKAFGAGAIERGLVVVAPDRFGLAGDVLAKAAGRFERKAYEQTLTRGLAAFRAPAHASPRDHIRGGRRNGVHWKTRIPVTDPGPRHLGRPPGPPGPPGRPGRPGHHPPPPRKPARSRE